jgi:hypothetical protein
VIHQWNTINQPCLNLPQQNQGEYFAIQCGGRRIFHGATLSVVTGRVAETQRQMDEKLRGVLPH